MKWLKGETKTIVNIYEVSNTTYVYYLVEKVYIVSLWVLGIEIYLKVEKNYAPRTDQGNWCLVREDAHQFGTLEQAKERKKEILNNYEDSINYKIRKIE